MSKIATIERSPEKAGVGGSIPSLATTSIVIIVWCYLAFDPDPQLSKVRVDCTGFCTDCLRLALTACYWPFLEASMESIELKDISFNMRSL